MMSKALLGICVYLWTAATATATATAAATESGGYAMLESIFHEQLFSAHQLTGISSSSMQSLSWMQAHQDAYVKDRVDEHIPVLCCIASGTDQQVLFQRLQQRLGALTSLRVDHTTHEECYLLHTTPSQLTLWNEEEEESEGVGVGKAQLVMLPPLLKIHPSVLDFMDSPSSSSSSSSSPISVRPEERKKSGGGNEEGMESESEGGGVQKKSEGDDLELVVQLLPHVHPTTSATATVSPQQCLETVLKQWTGDHADSSVRGAAYFSQALADFSSHLHEDGDEEHTAWGKHRQGAVYEYFQQQHSFFSLDPTSQSSSSSSSSSLTCHLPSTAEVEYTSEQREGGGLARIVNLSNMWTYTGSPDSNDSPDGPGGAMSSPRNYCFLRLVEMLSLQPSVLSVSITARAKTLNYNARGVLQSGQSGLSPLTTAGVLGKGQVVGVSDSGLDDSSCFFFDNTRQYSSSVTSRDGSVESSRRKVVQYSSSYGDTSDGVAGHGTHVVGSIVGESLSQEFAFANGVAPGAKVAFFDLESASKGYLTLPSDLSSSLFTPLHTAGARVMSNSWGGAYYYTSSCYDVDYFSYNNPDTLILFAAGNDGAEGTSTTLSPCQAKNSLCVGSMDASSDTDDSSLGSSGAGGNRVSFFSSMGPTFDGRIKPDVVGTGFRIVSAMAAGSSSSSSSSAPRSCGVYETFGTSMATPVVAGGAILLRDYFLSTWSSVCVSSYAYCHSFDPSGYLLKAVLIHSGVPLASYSHRMFDHKTEVASYSLSGTAPDYVQGYGAVNLHSIIPLTATERSQHDLYVADKVVVAGGSTVKLTVIVTDNTQPLKVSVVWFDKPSAANTASNLLLLNLDLKVQAASSGGTVWYGNGVNADTLNPQEQVYIASPTAGTYYVSVANTGGTAIKAGVVVTCHGRVSQEATTQGGGGGGASPDLQQQQQQEEQESQQLQADVAATGKKNDLLSASVANTATSQNDVASTGGAKSSPLTSANNINYAKTFTIATTLQPMASLLLGSLDVTAAGHHLMSIDISLDASYIIGSEAFIFSVVVYAPNGEIVQIGGFNQYVATDRYLNRMAPVHFTQLTAPSDSDSSSGYYSYSRTLSPLGLSQVGTYKVYAEMLHTTWEDTSYHGTVTLNFEVSTAAPTRHPTPSPTPSPTHKPTTKDETGGGEGGEEEETEEEGGEENRMDGAAKETVVLGLVVFCATLLLTFFGALYVRNRDQAERERASLADNSSGSGSGGGGGGDTEAAVVMSPLAPQQRGSSSSSSSAAGTGSGTDTIGTGGSGMLGATPGVVELVRKAAATAKAKARRGGTGGHPKARYSRASTNDDGTYLGIDL